MRCPVKDQFRYGCELPKGHTGEHKARRKVRINKPFPNFHYWR